MATGTVYRAPQRDGHGDPVDDDGRPVRLSGDGAAVGEITGIIVGARSVDFPTLRGNAVSTEGLLGWPVSSALRLQAGDVVAVNGIRYAVSGPPLWGSPHSLTGSPARYVWITATAN